MAKKYAVKEIYAKSTIVAKKPLTGRKDGRFILSECTQRDLKYLYEVVGFNGITVVEDGGRKKESEKDSLHNAAE